jgi:predicted small secreted protein
MGGESRCAILSQVGWRVPPRFVSQREIEMKNVICKATFLLAAAFLTMHSLGCNTVEGAGKDTERVGEKVQDAADRNK